VQKGGFSHLYITLKQLHTSESISSENAYKSSIIHLLDIIHYFVKDHLKELDNFHPTKARKPLALSYNSSKSLLQTIDFEEFVQLLLKFINGISLTKYASSLIFLQHCQSTNTLLSTGRMRKRTFHYWKRLSSCWRAYCSVFLNCYLNSTIFNIYAQMVRTKCIKYLIFAYPELLNKNN